MIWRVVDVNNDGIFYVTYKVTGKYVMDRQ